MNPLLSLMLIGTFSVSSLANDIDPLDMYEHMRTTLGGEWTLSAEDKQLGTTAYKNKYVLPLVGTHTTALAYKPIGFGSSLQEKTYFRTQANRW